jgi:hypothetical protein
MKTIVYGDQRTFTRDQSHVRAVPQLDGDKIERVIFTHMDGDRRSLEIMSIDIKNRYTGALYSTWQTGNLSGTNAT